MTHWENSWACQSDGHSESQDQGLFLHMENCRSGAANQSWKLNPSAGNLLINHMTNTHFLLSHMPFLYLSDFRAGRAEWKRHSFPEDRPSSNEALCEFAHVPTGGVLAIPLILPLIVTAHKLAECDFFCESRRRDYTAFPCNRPRPPALMGGWTLVTRWRDAAPFPGWDPVFSPHRSNVPRTLTKVSFT